MDLRTELLDGIVGQLASPPSRSSREHSKAAPFRFMIYPAALS